MIFEVNETGFLEACQDCLSGGAFCGGVAGEVGGEVDEGDFEVVA